MKYLLNFTCGAMAVMAGFLAFSLKAMGLPELAAAMILVTGLLTVALISSFHN